MPSRHSVALSLLVLLTAPVIGKDKTEKPGCTPERALAVLKKAIVEDVIADELDFAIKRENASSIISGTYKEPTLGFEPIATIDAGTCRVTHLKWK